MNKHLTNFLINKHPALHGRPRLNGILLLLLGMIGVGYTTLLALGLFPWVFGFLTLLLGAISGFVPWGAWLLLFGLPVDAKGETPWWYLIGAYACITIGFISGIVVAGFEFYILEIAPRL